MRERADLIVRGGLVVTAEGVVAADVAVAGGRIAAVGASLSWTAPDEVDAAGLHVFPGGIDSHVHFNEPGRTDWETIANGSAALAAGGYTAFIDMPLNNLPVTTDGTAFDLKLKAASRTSLVDFGFWGGLLPGNLDELGSLVERGVMGFKAFMCSSGIDEFPACDEPALREGMRRIAALDSILLVHAEDQEIIDRASASRSEGKGPRDYADSRPPSAETEAITRALTIARETGCRLHVVHVSSAGGARLVDGGHRNGLDVSAETCPHYLLYVVDDLVRLGGIGKCSPPFRVPDDRAGLWDMVVDGGLSMVISDHSPSTLALKEGDDFFKLWGGISGCQSTRQLLLAQDRLTLPHLAALTSGNVARRFRIERKGEVAVGFDADLWLVDLAHEDVVRREDLLYRNPFSAHEGQRIRGRTVRTLVRGQTVFAEGRPASRPAGRLIRPGAGS